MEKVSIHFFMQGLDDDETANFGPKHRMPETQVYYEFKYRYSVRITLSILQKHTHTVYTHKDVCQYYARIISVNCHNYVYRQFKSAVSICSLTTSGRDVYYFLPE